MTDRRVMPVYLSLDLYGFPVRLQFGSRERGGNALDLRIFLACTPQGTTRALPACEYQRAAADQSPQPGAHHHQCSATGPVHVYTLGLQLTKVHAARQRASVRGWRRTSDQSRIMCHDGRRTRAGTHMRIHAACIQRSDALLLAFLLPLLTLLTLLLTRILRSQ